MTKDDPITNALVDKFFDPVINAESEEALRDWLKRQPTAEIERFLSFWNWANFPDRETILRQELRHRAEIEASKLVNTGVTDPAQPGNPHWLVKHAVQVLVGALVLGVLGWIGVNYERIWDWCCVSDLF